MKSLKLAVVLTALFTHLALQPVHIVTVETKSIITESKRGKKIQKKIEGEQKKLAAPFEEVETKIKSQEAKLLEKQKSLATDDEKFKTQASLLSPEARAEKYDELQRRHRDLDEEVAAFQRSMRQAHEDAKKVDQKLEMFYRREMMSFEQDIKALIEDVAKSEGWDIVLAKEAVIYANHSTDKTHVVIKKLDKQEEEKEEQEKKAASKK